MKSKTIYVWSGVQIVIGVLLLLGTAYMALSVLPKFKDVASSLGSAVDGASASLTAVNDTYSKSETNLFDTIRTLEDFSDRFNEIGKSVLDAGGILLDAPLLKKPLNGIGENICGAGRDIMKFGANIREQSKLLDNCVKDVHPHATASLSEASMVLKNFSILLNDSQAMHAYGLYICLLGVVVSLMFIMNGAVLMGFAQSCLKEH